MERLYQNRTIVNTAKRMLAYSYFQSLKSTSWEDVFGTPGALGFSVLRIVSISNTLVVQGTGTLPDIDLQDSAHRVPGGGPSEAGCLLERLYARCKTRRAKS